MNSINDSLLFAINGLAGHVHLLDKAMIFCAKYLIFALGAAVAVWAIVHLVRKQWRPVVGLVVSLAISFVLLEVISKIVNEQRPFVTHHLNQLIAHSSGASFPSDHTTASFAMAFGLLFFAKRKTWGILALIAAAVIGFSRIYCGVHYPGDVLAGIVVGLVGAGIARLLVRPPKKQIVLGTPPVHPPAEPVK